MTSTRASYVGTLVTPLAAAVAVTSAIVVLLAGRVAELHSQVAVLVRLHTRLRRLADLGRDASSDCDRSVMNVPRQRMISDQGGGAQQAHSLADTPGSRAGAMRRHHGQPPGPLRVAAGAGNTGGGVWRGPSDH
jgi:hypothetical protein